MPINFEKLDSPTLRSQIARRVRRAILDGSLKPGERIVERKLASEFGASLTAVREALIELETEGFVSKKPNSFTCVTEFSILEIEKVFELRKLLEPYAFAEAARQATPEGIAHLEALYLDVVSAATRNDPRAYVHNDFVWHEAVWCMADNECLTAALRRIILPLFRFAAIRFHGGDRFDLLGDATSHMPLLEAIKARNPKMAREAILQVMDEWIEGIRAYVANGSDSEGTKPSP
jgi:DNA-binding GntR family transcriptional regulator